MPTTPPPTLDESSVAAAVPKSGKERALGAIGGILSAGSGKDPSESPLVQAMNKHHQQQTDIAQKHYKDFQTYTGILATGIDPDTGKPLTAENAEKYYNLRQLSGDALDKVAGSNKDIKEKLGRFRMLADHIVKLHPKAGGGGDGEGSSGASRTPPPPSAMDSLKQGADSERLRGEQKDQQEFTQWKRQQEALRDYKIQEKEAEAKAKAASPSTRAVMGPAISVSNARSLAMQGKTFNDADGNPIDLTSLPDSMGLKNVIHGGKSYYEPFSPNSKVITVGNETYAVSPMDVEAVSKGAGTDLGQHNVPKTSTRETIGVDANGNPVKQPLTTTTQPSAPGVKGRTSPPPKLGAGGSAVGPRAQASVAMTPGMYNTQTTRAIPVREAATQVFGDPTQPKLKSLKDYAPLADNAQSRAKLAAALNLTFDELDKKEKEAGSLLTLIERYGGVPQALAESKAAVTGDAIKSLSPQERDAYDAIMSTYGAVVGLRSLTKASAAQFSVKKLEQELPLPGINSTSSRQYYDQLSRLAEQVYNGTRTLGDAVMPKEEKEFYKKQVGELLKLKQGGSASRTSPPPKSGPKSVDDEIMEAVGAAKGKH
jgi:hypothetical protein